MTQNDSKKSIFKRLTTWLFGNDEGQNDPPPPPPPSNDEAKPDGIPPFIKTLFEDLRRRKFPLSPADYNALRLAMQAGFGWESPESLQRLLIALWVKSPREERIFKSLFAQLQESNQALGLWKLPQAQQTASPTPSDAPALETPSPDSPDSPASPLSEALSADVSQQSGGLPPIFINPADLPDRPLIFEPQHPLSHREIAQAWRRLRQPERSGPPIELDVQATIRRYSRRGVAAGVVLRPRRRNTARLLLLVDSQGSMRPFAPFVEEICSAITEAGNLANVARFYFHDVPAEGADEAPLDALPNVLFPKFDTVLDQISPFSADFVYTDENLLQALPLPQVLADEAPKAAIVIISDAGAARRQYDTLRLLDTLSFLKALYGYSRRVVWLNPLPETRWENTLAEQIARYVPMFPLSQVGMYEAVNVLRGHPTTIEKL